jgi:hypothetical protein
VQILVTGVVLPSSLYRPLYWLSQTDWLTAGKGVGRIGFAANVGAPRNVRGQDAVGARAAWPFEQGVSIRTRRQGSTTKVHEPVRVQAFLGGHQPESDDRRYGGHS